MKSEHKTEVTLVLTLEETQWLHYVMQNPITHVQGDPTDEDEKNSEMRKKFFNATDLR